MENGEVSHTYTSRIPILPVKFEHSHNVMVAEAFSYLRMTLDTQNTFLKYFDDGMTPSVARAYHEMFIESQYEGPDLYVHLSNAQVIPTERQVNYLYEKWRTANFGTREEKSILDVLRQKEESLSQAGLKLILKENPLIIIVLTPIMLRAHRRDYSHDIVFIDSSGSCDQTNISITFLFAASKIGAVPLACILHTEQSEANYTLAFSLLREKLGNEGFGGFGFPNVIMTDDSLAERNSLRTVFPESHLLLCIFHVLQAFWRWLWSSNHGISKDHRKIIMTQFQRLLYSVCKENAEEIYNETLSNEIYLLYDNLIKYVKGMWECKRDWILCFRNQLLTKGHNTNNFAEASIRIFKDIVLQRCRAFNACALVDFFVTVFESYHRKHLLTYANNRKNKYINNQMLQQSKNISTCEYPPMNLGENLANIFIRYGENNLLFRVSICFDNDFINNIVGYK
ncbi:uncharacterized protein LOC126734669 [Anthonomus grandis grandis]|uniref:uncharacterized protein LOC126734669 n=1 Tax=Anthonomus grandis grandis TaxID=2921223 RepID=UPI0021668C77|nr:uncharacterized protein LOC126734669 [Anthonomus grandis grandis]